MRVLITGIDGYLGWALALHLKARGHEVAGIDLGLRRQWVAPRPGQSQVAAAGRPLPWGIAGADLPAARRG